MKIVRKEVGHNFYCHEQKSRIIFTGEDIRKYCKVGNLMQI